MECQGQYHLSSLPLNQILVIDHANSVVMQTVYPFPNRYGGKPTLVQSLSFWPVSKPIMLFWLQSTARIHSSNEKSKVRCPHHDAQRRFCMAKGFIAHT